MNEQYFSYLLEQIAESETILAKRSTTILTLVQQQNRDRIRLQRLIELLEELQETPTIEND